MHKAIEDNPMLEYDPSDGMETVEELKKYVRFLYELNQEKDERILRMESDMSEIKNDLKEANRRADEEAAGRKRLFDKLEKFMDEQKSDSDKYKDLRVNMKRSKVAMTCYVQHTMEEVRLAATSIAAKRMMESMMAVTILTELYKREDYYASHPDIYKTPEMIKDARNDEYTNGIVNSMQKNLLDLIAKGEDYFPDKMWRALKYFHTFWDKIFAYRNDGEYSIDNMAVERAIRPLTVQRKNSLFLCSNKGAKNSGIYNTFISTCVQQCRNFRDFFVDYVRAWNQGRRDFGRSSFTRLLPSGRKNLVKLAFAPCS